MYGCLCMPDIDSGSEVPHVWRISDHQPYMHQEQQLSAASNSAWVSSLDGLKPTRIRLSLTTSLIEGLVH